MGTQSGVDSVSTTEHNGGASARRDSRIASAGRQDTNLPVVHSPAGRNQRQEKPYTMIGAGLYAPPLLRFPDAPRHAGDRRRSTGARMPQAARRRPVEESGDDPIQRLFEDHLRDYVVDNEAAAGLLGLDVEHFGNQVRSGEWYPWLEPALIVGKAHKPSAYLFWRKRIEELARLRLAHPHKPGPGKWAEELRAIVADSTRQQRRAS